MRASSVGAFGVALRGALGVLLLGSAMVQSADPPESTLADAANNVCSVHQTVLDGINDDYGIFPADAGTKCTCPPVENKPPTVDAGPDMNICSDTARLSGSVIDVGRAAGNRLTVLWSTKSGPGTVEYSNAAAQITNASFSQPGVYVLELSAFDGEFTDSDTVQVAVERTPTVNAGPKITVQRPSITAALKGSVSPASSAASWSKLSGPGRVSFADASKPETTARFSADGNYSLRLTASNACGSVADTLRVSLRGSGPFSDAGPDQLICTRTASLTGEVGPEGSAASWSKESGPGTVSFGDRTRPTTTATFSAPGVYRLRLEVQHNGELSEDSVEIEVNEPPEVDAGGSQSVSPGGTAQLTGNVNDDGLPRSGMLAVEWTQIDGPGTVIFADRNSATTTATFPIETGDYTLMLTANDGAECSDSASDVVTISVGSDGLMDLRVDAGPDQQLMLRPSDTGPPGPELAVDTELSAVVSGEGSLAGKSARWRVERGLPGAIIASPCADLTADGEETVTTGMRFTSEGSYRITVEVSGEKCSNPVPAASGGLILAEASATVSDSVDVRVFVPCKPAEYLPDGTIGQDYSQNVSDIVQVTGTLPNDIVFNSEERRLEGSVAKDQPDYARTRGRPESTPEWIYPFGVVLSGGIEASRCMRVHDALAAPGGALPLTRTGLDFYTKLEASGGNPEITDGDPVYEWSVVPPPDQESSVCEVGMAVGTTGLCLTEDGQLGGTTVAAGEFTLAVSDAGNPQREEEVSFTLPVTPHLAIVTDTPLPDATAGIAYQTTLQVQNGISPVRWKRGGAGELEDGDAPAVPPARPAECPSPDLDLPKELDLDPATGDLLWTPSENDAGRRFCFLATVNDALGPPAGKWFWIDVRVPPPPPIVILPPETIDANEDKLIRGLKYEEEDPKYPYEVQGVLEISFQSNAIEPWDVEDTDPRFLREDDDGFKGSDCIRFIIRKSSSEAQFGEGSANCAPSPSLPLVRAGTVAGKITYKVDGVTVHTTDSSITDFPGVAATASNTIERSPPVITEVVRSPGASGFSVRVTGFSTIRKIRSVLYEFQPTSGETVDGLTHVVELDYGRFFDAKSGVFGIDQPFTIEDGDLSDLNAVRVTVTDWEGRQSAPVSMNLP
jgi:K319-like protein